MPFKPAYQPWYEGDFWTLRVRHMNKMARLMYRSILQGAWDLPIPGKIPNDPEMLMRLADCPDQKTWERHEKSIMAMFDLSKNGRFLTNKRQQSELRSVEEKYRSHADRGSKGGNKKKQNSLVEFEDHSPATAEHSSDINQRSIQNQTRTKPEPEPNQNQEDHSAEASSAQVVIELPLNTGKDHKVLDSSVLEWKRLYPAVDVGQELNKMRGWIIANPTKRKTASGINRFINSWLAKAQDRGGTSPIEIPKSTNGVANGSNRAEREQAINERAAARAIEAISPEGDAAGGTPVP